MLPGFLQKSAVMRTIITNIRQLLQTYDNNAPARIAGADMDNVPHIDNAWLIIENGYIHSFGSMSTLPAAANADEHIDATGSLVLPAWCDSHTHLVFGGELSSLGAHDFKDLSKIEFVGMYPNYAEARKAWKAAARAGSDQSGGQPAGADGVGTWGFERLMDNPFYKSAWRPPSAAYPLSDSISA